MAGHPLRPATRRCLGGPLPHQQADRPRAHPSPPELSTTIRCLKWSYPVLAPVSGGYPDVKGRLLTCYSPVRRSCTPKGLTARLACVKHAASVRPEPGSNSPLNSCDSHKLATVNSWCFHPGKRTISLTIVRIIVCLTKGTADVDVPARGRNKISRTGIINSSTFGTLLSSQGSSAHRSQASQPFRGATC